MSMDLPAAFQACNDLNHLSHKGEWPNKIYPTWAKKINDQYHTDGVHIVQNVAWPLIADIFRHKLLQAMHALDDIVEYAERECECLYSMDDDPEIKEEAEKAGEAVSDANDLLKGLWKAFK